MNGGPGSELRARRAEQFPHLGNYTLTTGGGGGRGSPRLAQALTFNTPTLPQATHLKLLYSSSLLVYAGVVYKSLLYATVHNRHSTDVTY